MGKLEGGYINDVNLVDGFVRKDYVNGAMVGVNPETRKRREAAALQRFGGTVAPALIGVGKLELHQEFIPGINAENHEKNEDLFVDAGKLLRSIHCPVRRPFEYFVHDFERRTARSHEKSLPILDSEGVQVDINFDWDIISKFGTTRVHRDLWLGNMIKNGHMYAIDWELAGIGSPYEDFAVADLWIFREYGGHDAFWRGYGMQPDQDSVQQFLKAKCLTLLATTSLEQYRLEDTKGFYHNKVAVLKTL